MNKSKLFVALILLVVSGSVFAEWTRVGSGEDTEVYADKASVARDGNLAKMASMYDFVSPVPFDEKVYQSMVHVNQFDCKKSKIRRLSLAFYAGTKAEGEVIYSDNDASANWKRVTPGTANDVAMNLACGKA